MKIPIAKIVSPEFISAFQKLSTIVFPKFEDNLQVAKAFHSLNEATNAFAKTKLALLQQHGTATHDGQFSLTYDAATKVNGTLAKIGETTVDIPLERLTLPASSPLSGRDLFELGDFITNLDSQPTSAVSAPTKDQNAP